MKNCIIHIGMHKTGTSSIQQSLKGFEDDSFVYADIDGRPNHSLALLNVFSEKESKDGINYSSNEDLSKEILLRLSDSIQQCGDRTYIVSGEGISFFSKSELSNMYQYFGSYFDNVTIAAAVRAPSAYMASAFQEGMKRGGKDYLNIEHRYKKYKNIFSKFDEVFGRDNVCLWKFDPSVYKNGCAVQDFCNRFGISLSDEKIVRVNESISREVVGLLLTYRKLAKHLGSMSMTGPQNARLVKALEGIGDTKFCFSPDVVRYVLAKNRKDMDWIESRLGESLHEELGEHQAGDVREEADLLKHDHKVIDRLLSILGDQVPDGNNGETAEEIALLVHAIYEHSNLRKQKNNHIKIVRVEPERVLGWAIGSDFETPVRIALFINGDEIAQVISDKMRTGLLERGVHPSGRCGFVFHLDKHMTLKVGDKISVESIDGALSCEKNIRCLMKESQRVNQ